MSQFEEKLSNIVFRFPCLYDKTKKEYHDKNVVKNAWEAVANELELENGDRAKKLFENLKKRFSKKRNDVRRNASRSGQGTADVSKVKGDLEAYNFLMWLIPYIRTRTTKTNIPAETNIDEDSNETADSQFYDTAYIEASPPEDSYGSTNVENEEESTSNDIEESNLSEEEQETSVAPIAKPGSSKRKNVPIVSEKPKWSKPQKKSDPVELQFLSTVQNLIQGKEKQKENMKKQDANDLFGMTIAAEIKLLPKNEQILVKSKIRNVLTEAQMKLAGVGQENSLFPNLSFPYRPNFLETSTPLRSTNLNRFQSFSATPTTFGGESFSQQLSDRNNDSSSFYQYNKNGQ